MDSERKATYQTRGGRIANRVVIIRPVDVSDVETGSSISSDESLNTESEDGSIPDLPVFPRPCAGSANPSAEVVSVAGTYQWKKLHLPPKESSDSALPQVDAQATSPLDFFRMFMDGWIIEHLATETNRYSVEMSGKSINCSFKEMESYIAITLLMGICKLPTIRMYWNPHYRFAPIADTMGLNRFETIKRYFHVNDNNLAKAPEEEGHDVLFKVRPMLNRVRDNCRKQVPEMRQCVDEQMVKFKGRSRLKRYMPKKPIRWGYKVIARCGESGFIYDFHIDGDNFPRPEPSIGYTGDIVIHLCSTLPHDKTYYLYCDRFYTSLPLFQTLKEKNILSIGTIQANRMKGCPLKKDGELSQRGDYDFATDATSNITILKWMDRKGVLLCSNFAGVEPVGVCERFVKKEKKRMQIPCPSMVTEYNKHMGGVDLFDMLKGLYDIDRRGRKYYIRLCHYLYGVCAINAWLLYRRRFPEVDLLSFIGEVAQGLAKSQVTKKRGRPSAQHEAPQPPARRRRVQPSPCIDVRCDQEGHFPLHTPMKGRCRFCTTGYTRWLCEKCQVPLCLNQTSNCFRLFHK